jgi:2-oxoglutarate dehydrogenase E2 component (dihydrolipoamide succinyltransferase)
VQHRDEEQLMPVELKVPEMGESVTEVYVGRWQKKVGERVEQDDPLVELESEKATVDLRAPSAGVLSKILKHSGESAEVGEVIGQIDSDGAEQKVSQRSDENPKREEPTKKEQAATNGEPKVEQAVKKDEPRTAAKSATDEEPPKDTVAKPEPKKDADEKDEKKAEPQRAPAAPVAAKQVDEAVETQEKPPEHPRPSAGREEVSGGEREERVLMSPIRRRIAVRLVEAQQNAALLTTFNEVDMTAVKTLRAEHGEAFERRHGVRLGFMSFFVKATVEALRQFPEINAMIDGDEIVYRRYYDIGVAISSDKGLVVPVLRDADRLGFAQIEQAIVDFAKRAREGTLKVNELQGGTFTITNGGVFGSLLSTPIVNPPQSGVLGMHAIQNRPVAIDDQVAIRPMMYVALTYDHRIIDGREAVTFLRRIKETIEGPARMLVEV